MYASKYSNQQILNLMNQKVYGHSQAKKVLINSLNRSKMRWQQIYNLGLDPKEAMPLKHVFLLGRSGSGKSYLVETLSQIVDMPFMRFDATQLVPAGYKGSLDVEAMVKSIQVHCAHIAQQSGGQYTSQEVMNSLVVFWDELDKLAQTSERKWGQQIQSSLLHVLDGEAELQGVTFICAGAFSSVLDSQDENSKSFGFCKQTGNCVEPEWDSLIIESGMMPELIGRMGSVVKLDELTIVDYNNILDDYILPEAYKILEYYECLDFYLEADQRETIINKAMKSGQGVRMLRKEVQKLTEEYEFNFEERKDALLLEYVQQINGGL